MGVPRNRRFGKQSEQQSQSGISYFDHPAIAFFRLTPDLKLLLDFNRSFPELLGYGIAEFTEKYSSDIWINPRIFKQKLKISSAEESQSNFETEVMANSGEKKQLQISARLTNADGRGLHIEATAIDVTVIRSLETELVNNIGLSREIVSLAMHIHNLQDIQKCDVVNNSLAEIARLTGLDIVYVYLDDMEKSKVMKKFEWVNPASNGIPKPPDSMAVRDAQSIADSLQDLGLPHVKVLEFPPDKQIKGFLGIASQEEIILPHFDLDILLGALVIVFSNNFRRLKFLADISGANMEITQKASELRNKEIALNELLSNLAMRKNNFESNIQANIDRLVIPRLASLRRELGPEFDLKLRAVEEILNEITSAFVGKMETLFKILTPREIEICEHLKKGMSSKMVANYMRISAATVNKHRERIRKKLEIDNKDINLTVFLQSL